MRVTEKKRVKIDPSCKSNPVFIAWVNTLGGREHWLFHKRQTDLLNTEEQGNFEPTIDDLETARGQIESLSMKAEPQLICYDQVMLEDLEGLKTLKYAKHVEVLTNPDTWQTEGCKWIRYRVVAGSFKIRNTDELRADIDVTFILPYLYNVSA